MGSCIGTEKREKKPAQLAPVLLIGTAGSGKSTFSKQMQLIHNTPLDNNAYKSILLSNVIIGMQERLALMRKFDQELEGEYLRCNRTIADVPPWDAEWTESFASAIKKLWESKTFNTVHQMSSVHQLQISHLEYLMQNLDNYLKPEYVPTNDDLLRARQRTTGCNEICFTREKNAWTLVDLGGQFCEREKWASYLGELQNVDDVQQKLPIAFIAFVALDEFDVKSNEEPTKTKFMFSLEVICKFAKIQEAESLLPIVFLNKVDLFEQKLKTESGMSSFKKNFPDFKGATFEEASKFIEEYVSKRLDVELGEEKAANIPVKITCVLDGVLMDKVFQQIQFYCFSQSLSKAGMPL